MDLPTLCAMFRRVLVPLAALVLAAGCSSGEGKTADPQAPAPPASSSAPSTSAASPSEEAPKAADGTDLAACSDGTCEVSAPAGAKMTFPAKTRVEYFTVQSIDADTVVLAGRGIGSRQGGSCTGKKCESSGSGKDYKVTLGPSSTATFNDLSITLRAITGGAAVLKIEPR